MNVVHVAAYRLRCECNPPSPSPEWGSREGEKGVHKRTGCQAGKPAGARLDGPQPLVLRVSPARINHSVQLREHINLISLSNMQEQNMGHASSFATSHIASMLVMLNALLRTICGNLADMLQAEGGGKVMEGTTAASRPASTSRWWANTRNLAPPAMHNNPSNK